MPEENARPYALVVDDMPGIRNVLRAVFEQRDWYVVEASDGGSALYGVLEKISPPEPLPDVIFLDGNMPGMDGPTLERMLGQIEKYKDIRVIGMSGLGVRGSDVGFSDRLYGFLSKPFDMKKLDEYLETLERIRAPELSRF